MKKYIAETFGTGVLALAVSLSVLGAFPVPTPVIAGLVLLLFVYSLSHVSGTHINPAVTLGLLSLGKIEIKQSLGYLLAQFAGASAAIGLVVLTIGTTPPVGAEESLTVFLAELIGMTLFTFGIASVVFGKVHEAMGGVVIGGSLLLGITLAVLLGSNGILNPAVALALGSFNVVYVAGPIIGSMLGMWLYRPLGSQ